MRNTGTLYRSTEKTPTVFPEFRDLLPPLSQEQQEALDTQKGRRTSGMTLPRMP